MSDVHLDEHFTAFLLDTKRIYSRRKEDLQTRRAADKTPTLKFTTRLFQTGADACRALMVEYDAWASARGVQPNRRRLSA